MSGACFRNTLLIGCANASDINQLTFDWKAGCWDCSVCRKSLNCLRDGNPKLKLCCVPRGGCNRLKEMRPKLRQLARGPGGVGERADLAASAGLRRRWLPGREQFPF